MGNRFFLFEQDFDAHAIAGVQNHLASQLEPSQIRYESESERNHLIHIDLFRIPYPVILYLERNLLFVIAVKPDKDITFPRIGKSMFKGIGYQLV